MDSAQPWLQELRDCRDTSLVGGKAINLGELLRAGFSVPDGFVVTTEAYRAVRAADHGRMPDDLRRQIIAAWRQMDSVPVAVRSSATAEDLAEASMAGQYDTFLNIAAEEALLDAIGRCWASLDSPRTRSYLAEHGIDLSKVAMAVVVQQLVPADVAGVIFTANPHTGSREEMLVEASWGLGEAVVSGLVQPDVLRLDRETGRVIHQAIADKAVWIPPGSHDEAPVEDSRRRLACLGASDIELLWRMASRSADYFQSPQDMEFAIHDGRAYLLQSRAITTLEHVEAYEKLLQSSRDELRRQLGAGRGPWALHNLSETLKHPTPLTWSVIKRFMSGSGGFGEMYRMAGFEPSVRVCGEGFLERIAGRVYMDLSVAAEMFFDGYAFNYDVELLRRQLDAAQNPPTVPYGTMRQRIRTARRVRAVNRKLHAIAEDFSNQLAGRIIPKFTAWCAQEKARDLAGLSTLELIELWRERERKVMDEFAPKSLLPSLIAAMAIADLRQMLDECIWDEDPDELANVLAADEQPDLTVLANAQLYEVAQGLRTLDQWLADHGHRAPDEFDLATPRWREQPDALRAMAAHLKSGADPLELHRHRISRARQRWQEISRYLRDRDTPHLRRRMDLARRYMPWRENAKHYLMLGYDLLRDVALEASRRLEIDSGVFQLTLEELLEALRESSAPRHAINERTIVYGAEQRVVLPQIIDSAAIDTLGQPPRLESTDHYPAFALSTGYACGPARIVCSPQDAGDLGAGYVLVCPSTDPGWTPLFVNASGLVLECGGALSHGAVVAREMNIPAVVVPGATKLFADGEVITVDGRHGAVSRSARIQPVDAAESAEPDESDAHIPRNLVPPGKSRFERSANILAFWCAVVWGFYLAAAFLLPERWLYQPSLRAMDFVLWPVVRLAGKPGTVIIVAAAMAVGTMLLQRLATDNKRLREAKRRSTQLTQAALKLPRGAPRRQAMLGLAHPVQWRIVMASLVPLAILLGPMAMTFSWLPARVLPTAANAPAGAAMTATATVSSDLNVPVVLHVPEPLGLHPTSTPMQAALPVRQTLQKWADDPAGIPARLVHASGRSRDDMARDLRSFLAAGTLPPQSKRWNLVADDRTAGRFPITFAVPNHTPLTVYAVLGDEYPPEPEETIANPDTGLISVRLTYVKSMERRPFWPILGTFGFSDWAWLVVYLVAYLPVMFIARWVLRVA